MTVFIGKVNSYMFRPKAAISGYHNYNFAQSVIYMSILQSDVEISSSHYVLQVSLSSGMSGGSMDGGVWVCSVGYVLRGRLRVVYGGGAVI